MYNEVRERPQDRATRGPLSASSLVRAPSSHCDCAKDNPVISTLPSLLKLDAEQGGAAEWMRSTFQYAAEEVAAGRPGSETVLAKLSELLFIEAVRRYAQALPQGQTGWLAGLRDPYVARALALLHHNIARHWNVDDLSRKVGLSRSALADRFISLIGLPPMHYVASWRMQVATQKLRNTQRVPCASCRLGRLQFRGRFFPRLQEGVRNCASHLAFEQTGLGPICTFESCIEPRRLTRASSQWSCGRVRGLHSRYRARQWIGPARAPTLF